MSKVDDMLKATRLPDLVLDLGRSYSKDVADKLFFSINQSEGAIEIRIFERDLCRAYIPKEHAMIVANWIIENYGD